MANQHHQKSPQTVRLIGVCKFVYGVLLAAAALGVFHLLGQDWGGLIEHFIFKLHLDPENHITRALLRLTVVNHGQLVAFAVSSAVFALLEIVEGAGLAFQQSWASYLTVISTCLLLIPECYEIAQGAHPLRIVVFVINLAVAIYLAVDLKKQHHA